MGNHVRDATAAEHGAPPGTYTVTVSFLIDTTGKVTEVTIIQDAGYGTADDVLHAFKKAPKMDTCYHEWQKSYLQAKAKSLLSGK